jgi:uncharacterized integral membrane protein
MLRLTMYLIALLVVFVLFGVFAAQNGGTQDFTFLGYTFHLQSWVPTAIGTGIVSALLMLHMGAAGLGHRFREIGHGRALHEHRGVIEDLRDENSRLREELAAARGEVRGAAGGAGGGSRRSLLEGVRSLPSRVAGRDRTSVA